MIMQCHRVPIDGGTGIFVSPAMKCSMASTPTCLQRLLASRNLKADTEHRIRKKERMRGEICNESFRATHVVSISLVNSSMSSARAYIQNSLKLMSVTQYCGFSRHARKNSTEEVASQRCREAVKLWPSSQNSGGAVI